MYRTHRCEHLAAVLQAVLQPTWLLFQDECTHDLKIPLPSPIFQDAVVSYAVNSEDYSQHCINSA